MSASSGDDATRRHSRHGSTGRATIARRPTRGPLDVADSPLSPSPLSQSSTPINASSPSVPPLVSTSSGLLSPTQSQSLIQPPRLPSPAISSDLSKLTISTEPSFKTARTSSPAPPVAVTQKDFSYLLNPQIYHPLSHLDIPPPFRSLSNHSFSQTTNLEELLRKGQFRAAAIFAANKLTALPPNNISPYDHETIFSLVYTRLSCLTLCNQTTLAAQEVKALEDLNSAFYRDGDGGSSDHLVPWELRVLAVRLQGMGFNDVRRGVMGFYDLAKDVRHILTTLKKDLAESVEEEGRSANLRGVRLWEGRLHDLGVRVASSLVEMEDFDGANYFLSTLKSTNADEDYVALQKALLYLTIGHVDAARACLASGTVGDDAKTILALAHMADGDYDAAVTAWQELMERGTEQQSVLYKQNLAVALLYQGKMSDARANLETLVEDGDSFHALTFNLSTIYELCSERARGLKISLAERVAGLVEEDIMHDEEGQALKVRGWEKVNGDFKL